MPPRTGPKTRAAAARLAGVTTVVGDVQTRGQLRFDTQREVLERRLKQFGGRESRAIGKGGLSFDVSLLFSASERDAVEARREFRVELNRIIRNTGQRMVEKAQKLSKPTYDTGLFMSSWRAETDATSIASVRSKVSLTNKAPYALYVRRKGWGAGMKKGWPTVVNRLIKPMVRQTIRELVDDIAGSSRLKSLLRTEIVGSAAKGRAR